jgi:hypothetical protein
MAEAHPGPPGSSDHEHRWVLWEPRKRTWHDIVANSPVVSASFYPPGEFARLAR